MVLQRIRESQAFMRSKAFLKRYERWFMPAMLVGGTATDAVQFHFLQVQTTFLISGIYAVICAVCMILMSVTCAETNRVGRYAQLAAPFLQQFTLGALLSTSLLFYWFSGTVEISWPVIAIVALLMVSNEVFRDFVKKPVVQVAMLYFALFSLSATLAAYVFNSLSPWVFVVGGVASLLVMAAFLVVFLRAGKLFTQQKRMWLAVTGVFALMNICYFLNVIPPIPLSLRDTGLYYSLTRTGGDYIWEGEEETWLERLIPGQTLHMVAGEPLYVYTAIFAPAELTATMVHRWERYDTEEKKWVVADRLSFALIGGRQDGFRGYSVKRSLGEGKWRVTVETDRGQVLGRIGFTIEY